MAREFPSLQERREMLQIKDINHLDIFRVVVFDNVKMFFILIDSFGIEMHPKFRGVIDGAMKGKAPIRTKMLRVSRALERD